MHTRVGASRDDLTGLQRKLALRQMLSESNHGIQWIASRVAANLLDHSAPVHLNSDLDSNPVQIRPG